ncbi:MAG: hypothetical protein RR595_10915 [Lysinibacillus sp.]
MLDITKIKIRLHTPERIETTLFLHQLEVTDGEREYSLTNYEGQAFDYNIETGEILEPNRRVSLMNGKEYVFTAHEIFSFGNNKAILENAVQEYLFEYHQESNISAKVIKAVMKEVHALHKSHSQQARINLLDRSLVERDIELFKRMSKQIKVW